MDEQDENLNFDPSLKKKKKKKTRLNLDVAMAEGSTAPPSPKSPLDTTEVQEAKDTPEMDDMENLGEQKSEETEQSLFNADELADCNDKESGTKEGGDEEEAPAATSLFADIDSPDLELDFSKLKKKKRTKRKPVLSKLLTIQEENEEGEGDDENERDYPYDELVDRVFEQLRIIKPELAAGEEKKFVMRLPQVVWIGTKKTGIANFSQICNVLHRMPKHVLQFFLSELGTTGSIDGNNKMIIKGRFRQRHIENVLRRYIKEYVMCSTCRSMNTILVKNNRLLFLQCERCHSRISVAPIKSGFQAVTNKRQRQTLRNGQN